MTQKRKSVSSLLLVGAGALFLSACSSPPASPVSIFVFGNGPADVSLWVNGGKPTTHTNVKLPFVMSLTKGPYNAVTVEVVYGGVSVQPEGGFACGIVGGGLPKVSKTTNASNLTCSAVRR